MGDVIVCDNIYLDVEVTSHLPKENIRVASGKGIYDN